MGVIRQTVYTESIGQWTHALSLDVTDNAKLHTPLSALNVSDKAHFGDPFGDPETVRPPKSRAQSKMNNTDVRCQLDLSLLH